MRNFLRTAGVSYIFLSSFMLMISYLLVIDDRGRDVFIIGIIHMIISIITVVLIMLYIRRSLIKEFNKRCEFLDEAMSKKTKMEFNITDETLFSRENSKLKELVHVLESEKNVYEGEKKNIQSLITDLSHQIKTPLTNISMYNSMLLQKNLDGERQEEFLLSMEGQISKLQWLIDGLMKISRLESELITLREDEYAIEDALAMALSGVYSEAEKKNINIDINCDRNIRGRFDLRWSSEAFLNIIENSIKYSDKGKNIRVNVEELEIFVRVDIIDEGIGISKDELNKIFQRFYRSEEVREYKGLGIGLYLAREIILREGGYIKVSSKKGKGSVFSIFILK